MFDDLIDQGIEQVTEIVSEPVEQVTETVASAADNVTNAVEPPHNFDYQEIMSIQEWYNEQGWSPELNVDGLWGKKTNQAYEQLGLPPWAMPSDPVKPTPVIPNIFTDDEQKKKSGGMTEILIIGALIYFS